MGHSPCVIKGHRDTHPERHPVNLERRGRGCSVCQGCWAVSRACGRARMPWDVLGSFQLCRTWLWSCATWTGRCQLGRSLLLTHCNAVIPTCGTLNHSPWPPIVVSDGPSHQPLDLPFSCSPSAQILRPERPTCPCVKSDPSPPGGVSLPSIKTLHLLGLQSNSAVVAVLPSFPVLTPQPPSHRPASTHRPCAADRRARCWHRDDGTWSCPRGL